MEPYSSTKIYSSNSFSSSSSTSFAGHNQKKKKPYLSTLHRVGSLPSKSINKKPIAPLTPIPPKVYTVEVVNFRQVVQLLTAAPEFQSHYNSTSDSGHLQEVALPPSSSVVISIDDDSDESADEKDVGPKIPTDTTICDTSPLGFPQLPSSLAWCSSLLLSPDALTSLDSTTLLKDECQI